MYAAIEQLINIDYNNRAVDHLYEAGRKLSDKPVIERIAEEILKVPAGRYVFLTTGSVTRTWVTPRIAETDGPLGTAALAKRIREITSAVPVIITEASLVTSISAVTQASGLSVVTVEQAVAALEKRSQGQTSVACVLPFTENDGEAAQEAKELLEKFDPAMVISIEKAGYNEKKIYHNMRGYDYSPGRARVDYLVEAARIRGVTTVGVGDGGNEIGMGAIIDAVHKYVKYGAQCQCGCGGGIGACTATDILLTGSVSNWACYAICAALALKCGKSKWAHNAVDEVRMLNTAQQAGMVDGATGKAETTVDGFSMETNCALIEFMRALVRKKLDD
ncbi:glutamate cyclase domain-containing protein [uncultured Cloacibacillus sp.]|uniref:glutamate cyclase domain-containing protein n=1 Tax=uncultured Cloacibacillus sp. TaxID=889794 RepID=UPI0026DBDAC5|nr:glutamate cyclase domain-containing protein [uncultured Cloacibacillus sp.]